MSQLLISVLSAVIGGVVAATVGFVLVRLWEGHQPPPGRPVVSVVIVVLPVALVFLMFGAAFALIEVGQRMATANSPPVGEALVVSPRIVVVGGRATLALEANDPDEDPLVIVWEAIYGSVVPSGPTAESVVEYCAPSYLPASADKVTARIEDGRGGKGTISQIIQIVARTQATRTLECP